MCKIVYIGETGISIKTRENEHKRAIRNGDDIQAFRNTCGDGTQYSVERGENSRV